MPSVVGDGGGVTGEGAIAEGFVLALIEGLGTFMATHLHVASLTRSRAGRCWTRTREELWENARFVDELFIKLLEQSEDYGLDVEIGELADDD